MSKLRKEGECSEKIIFLCNRLSRSLLRNKVALMFKLAEFHRCLKSQSGQTLKYKCTKNDDHDFKHPYTYEIPPPPFRATFTIFLALRPKIMMGGWGFF